MFAVGSERSCSSGQTVRLAASSRAANSAHRRAVRIRRDVPSTFTQRLGRQEPGHVGRTVEVSAKLGHRVNRRSGRGAADERLLDRVEELLAVNNRVRSRSAVLPAKDLVRILRRMVEQNHHRADRRRDQTAVVRLRETVLEHRGLVAVYLESGMLLDRRPAGSVPILDHAVHVAVLAERPVLHLDGTDPVSVVQHDEIRDVHPETRLHVDRPAVIEGRKGVGDAQFTCVEPLISCDALRDRWNELCHTHLLPDRGKVSSVCLDWHLSAERATTANPEIPPA